MKTTIIKTILFLIIFLKSFDLYSENLAYIPVYYHIYDGGECYASTNSYQVAQHKYNILNYTQEKYSNIVLPYYGDVSDPDLANTDFLPYSVTFSQLPNYDCLSDYVSSYDPYGDYRMLLGTLKIFSFDSEGNISNFYRPDNVTTLYFSISFLMYIRVTTSPMENLECPSPSYSVNSNIDYISNTGRRTSYNTSFCSYNSLRFEDPACLSFLDYNFDIYLDRPLTDIEKGSPLTVATTENLGDPNDINNNLYCRLDYVEEVKNDGSCYQYTFQYSGDSYDQAYAELYDLPPDVSFYQLPSCSYILTDNPNPNPDPDNPDPDNPDLENPDPNNPDLETPDPEQDTDNDGIPDIEDPDIDGDGVNNEEDVFPNDPNESQDNDNDGVGNNRDVFPDDPNEDTDTDGDGIGNNTDTDDDNDGTPDVNDVFPLNPNEDTDTDGDGFGDNSDPDPNTSNNGTGEGETGEENEGDFGLGEMGYDERSFYEPKYPDGLTGVFTDNYNRIMEESSFGEILQSIDISQSIGTSQQYPVYEFEFDLFGEVYTNSIDTSNILDTGINFWVVLNTLLIFISILTAIKIIF